MSDKAEKAKMTASSASELNKPLGEFELSSRLASALRLAGALDLSATDFCRRLPPSELRKHRGFLRNTSVELVAILSRFASNSDVSNWLNEANAMWPPRPHKIPEIMARLDQTFGDAQYDAEDIERGLAASGSHSEDPCSTDKAPRHDNEEEP